MKRSAQWFVAVMFVAVPMVSGGERDELLEEVRGLRRDLHAVAVGAQRVQLLVFRTHVQAEVTRRAKARYDETSSMLKFAEFEASDSAAKVERIEGKIRSESDREKKRALESSLENATARRSGADETLAKQREVVGETQREYSIEQAKLDVLTSRLDQLERQLERLSASQHR